MVFDLGVRLSERMGALFFVCLFVDDDGASGLHTIWIQYNNTTDITKYLCGYFPTFFIETFLGFIWNSTRNLYIVTILLTVSFQEQFRN